MNMRQANPMSSVRMAAPMAAPMTYAAPPQMTYAALPGAQQQQFARVEQPQIVMEQPQMVYAAAPQQQLAVRTNPNNLFQNGQIVSEQPVSRGVLIQQGRLFEGDPEKPPVIIPGQMIDIQQLMLQQPQVVMEQPQFVMAAPPPMTYAQVPAVTVLEEQVQYAAAPLARRSVVQEPLAMNGFGPQLQYAAQPAGSVMVEQLLMAQPADGVITQPGSVMVVEYAQPEMPATKTGTMVMMPPEQDHMVAARRPSAAVPARKGTITNALFDLVDSNQDGKITRSEFRRGLKGEIIQVGQVANLSVRR